MNPTTSTDEYMLLFRSNQWEKDLSPQEMQAVMDRTIAWFDRLEREGKMKAAQPLFEEGKIVTGRKSRTVSDGPFSESKETVAGYLLLHVGSMEEATAIATGWPLLDVGATVEVRPVAPQCPSFQRFRESLQHEAAGA